MTTIQDKLSKDQFFINESPDQQPMRFFLSNLQGHPIPLKHFLYPILQGHKKFLFILEVYHKMKFDCWCEKY